MISCVWWWPTDALVWRLLHFVPSAPPCKVSGHHSLHSTHRLLKTLQPSSCNCNATDGAWHHTIIDWIYAENKVRENCRAWGNDELILICWLKPCMKKQLRRKCQAHVASSDFEHGTCISRLVQTWGHHTRSSTAFHWWIGWLTSTRHQKKHESAVMLHDDATVPYETPNLKKGTVVDRRLLINLQNYTSLFLYGDYSSSWRIRFAPTAMGWDSSWFIAFFLACVSVWGS